MKTLSGILESEREKSSLEVEENGVRLFCGYKNIVKLNSSLYGGLSMRVRLGVFDFGTIGRMNTFFFICYSA